MNSAPRRESSKAIVLQKNEKQNADPLWNVQNQQLQNEAQANSRLRQQITKQSYADCAIQANIKDKITGLKQKAVQIAQNLESEKRKNIQLQAIIRHMNHMRIQQKLIQSSHRDDMNFQNLNILFRKIKKSEYDLQQMFSRLNDLTSKNKEKKNEVDAYRTQRVIDSGIFLKIEKQIVQYQTQYKKLLIQKTKFEQQYSKNLVNYKKMKADIQKQQYISLSKRSSHQKQQENQQRFFENIPKIEHAVKFTQINQPKRKSFYASKKQPTNIQTKRQQILQQIQYAVKKVFIQTGLNDPDSLIHHLNNIQSINQQLFQEVDRGTDKINYLQQQINRLKGKREQKTIKYYQKQPLPTKTQIKLREAIVLQSEINKLDQNSSKISRNIQQFLKSSQIRQILKIGGLNNQQLEIQRIQQIFAQLQNNLNPIFNDHAEYKRNLMDEQYKLPKINEGQLKEQTIQDLISKVKKFQQSQKIMLKEDFKRQYELIRKNQNFGKSRNGKKKTTSTIQRKY